MGKSAAAKASEKRRRQRVKAENKLGLPVGALAKGGAPLAAAPAHKPENKKPSKLIRRCLEVGEVGEALEVLHRSQVGPAVCVDLAISCLNAGRALDACTAVQRMVTEGGKMPLTSLVSGFSKMSQRCVPSEIMHFVEIAVPHVELPGPPEHLAYLKHFVPLLVMEYIEGAQQSMEKIRSRGIASLASAGEAIGQLRARVTNEKANQLTLVNDRLGPYASACPRESNFFKGDIVYLERRCMSANSVPSCPYYTTDDQPGGGMIELEAEVLTLVPQFTLRALGSSAAAATWNDTQVDVFRLANRLTFTRQLAALQTLLGRQKQKGCLLHDVLCPGFGAPAPEACAAAIACVPSLCASPPFQTGTGFLHQVAAQVPMMQQHNSSQHAALQAAVTRRLTLIQGPPGTGKTTTAISLISLWLRSGRGPVLATSDSNIAVDNLLDGCIRAGMNVVRLGRAEAVRTDLNDYMLENQAQRLCPGGAAADRSAFHQAMQSILKRASVVCATCSGAGSEMVARCSFPSVLLDEASQATEPSSLIPLMKDAAQVALVGDHKQLPPTIVSREAELAGLNVSLFDRMVAAGVQPFMLDTQYRMHPGLAAFPAKAFYGGFLKSGVTAEQRPRPLGFAWPSPHIPIAFTPCDHGIEERNGSSYQNSAEATVVATIVSGFLAAREVSPADIGVVTPYASQVRLLRQLLNVQRVPGVPTLEVSSVDAFQGREKEVIVFSAVRSNASGSVGFLADARRVNVMLTRAKRGLVVVGSGPTLSREPTVWGPWLRWASGCGLVAGVPPLDSAALAALASGDFTASAKDVEDIKVAAPAPAPSPVDLTTAPPPPHHVFSSMDRHSTAAANNIRSADVAATPMLSAKAENGRHRWGPHPALPPTVPTIPCNGGPARKDERWGPPAAQAVHLPPLPLKPSDPPPPLPPVGRNSPEPTLPQAGPTEDERLIARDGGEADGRAGDEERVATRVTDRRQQRSSRMSRSRSRSLRGSRSWSPCRDRTTSISPIRSSSRSRSRDDDEEKRRRSSRRRHNHKRSKESRKRSKRHGRSRSRSPSSRRRKSHRHRSGSPGGRRRREERKRGRSRSPSPGDGRGRERREERRRQYSRSSRSRDADEHSRRSPSYEGRRWRRRASSFDGGE